MLLGGFCKEYGRHLFRIVGQNSHKHRLSIFWTFEYITVMEYEELCKSYSLQTRISF